jgi:hypothetical protein
VMALGKMMSTPEETTIYATRGIDVIRSPDAHEGWIEWQ